MLCEISVFEIAAKVGGVAGMCVALVLIIFREIIRKKIFPNLSRDHAFRVIRLIIICTSIVAIVGIVLGFIISPSKPTSIYKYANPKLVASKIEYDTAHASAMIYFLIGNTSYNTSFRNKMFSNKENYKILLDTIKACKKNNWIINHVVITGYTSNEGDSLSAKRNNTALAVLNIIFEKVKVKINSSQTSFAEVNEGAKVYWTRFIELLRESDIYNKDKCIKNILALNPNLDKMYLDVFPIKDKTAQEIYYKITPYLRSVKLDLYYEKRKNSDDDLWYKYQKIPISLSSDSFLYLAEIQNETSNKEEVYKKALEYYSNNWKILNNLACIYMKKKQYNFAHDILNSINAPEIEASSVVEFNQKIALANL